MDLNFTAFYLSNILCGWGTWMCSLMMVCPVAGHAVAVITRDAVLDCVCVKSFALDLEWETSFDLVGVIFAGTNIL